MTTHTSETNKRIVLDAYASLKPAYLRFVAKLSAEL